MSIRGKSINIYLMDGTAQGRIKCTLANWTGVAYKIPRTTLDECKGRADLKQSGVYFLFGIDDLSGENVVYIGQAGVRKNGEGLLFRLNEHKRKPDKDYWTEAIVFTTSNNSFGPTEISYLENRFCNLAILAKRYSVKNGNDPNIGNITEEKESEMEEFIDYARIVMGTLGHNVFESFLEKKSSAIEYRSAIASNASFQLISSKCNAFGVRSPEGFVVFQGSKLARDPTPSCPDQIRLLRESLKGKINADSVLQEDVLFRSPSAAAGFVTFGSANGLLFWKTSDGKSLKELENSEV